MRWLSQRSGDGKPRVEKATLVAVDHQRGQNACPVCPRVDPDPVSPLLNLGADGMAVDHDESVIGVVKQEWRANPAKVGLGLLLELDPGTDPGMDEQIIAKAAGIHEAVEELDVPLGNRRPDSSADRHLVSRTERRHIDAVTLETLNAAEPQPA